jgi:hypothetical protein
VQPTADGIGAGSNANLFCSYWVAKPARNRAVMNSFGSRPLPPISDIGLPLLVMRTIRKADSLKTPRFIKPAGAYIGLKAP